VSKNLFTVLKKLKECVGFFFFNNLIATNGSGIAEGRDFQDKSFNLAQIPNRSTND